MTRRSLFRTLTAVVVASAAEVMGWKVAVIPVLVDDIYSRLVADANATTTYEYTEYQGIIWYIRNDMPRYDYKDGEWIRRPYYKESA